MIGSGPAALALARTLMLNGKSVTLVERGGMVAQLPRRRIVFKATPYLGGTQGIAFGYGGTGALWGGQLLPMLDSELVELGSPWDSEDFRAQLHEGYRVIESWTGVSQTPYDDIFISQIDHEIKKFDWGELQPLFSKWVPFRRRNLAGAWKKLLSKQGLRVLLNLRPIYWKTEKQGDMLTVRQVICSSGNGSHVTVNAEEFVIAAGAIESVPIIERLIGSEASERIGLGRTLHDHLSIRIAELVKLERDQYERTFAAFFTGSTMRSLRICLPDILGHDRVWAYCHFTIEAPETSGFAVARDFLRNLQANQIKLAMKALLRLPSAVGEILRMLWQRFCWNRLALPNGARVFVNLDIVQSPMDVNRVVTGGHEGIDQPHMIIDWSIRDNYIEIVKAATSHIQRFWKVNQLGSIATIEPVDFHCSEKDIINNMYGIYHPAGTCAMGRVVDANLKVMGVTNAYIVGSSIFPMLGRANPTLTIMSLAHRLAVHLTKK